MKLLLTAAALCLSAMASFAQTDTAQTTQTDTVKTSKTDTPDTIRIGGMIIINRKGDGKDGEPGSGGTVIRVGNNKKRPSPKRVHTTWLNFDLGFTNFSDMTDYGGAAAREYARAVRPGEEPFTESDLNLRTGKSSNFNLWIVRQQLGITKNNAFHAKWGLMLETNNYRYENDISYVKGNRPYLFRDSLSFSKNKLSADYVTVPLMLGFSTNPRKSNSFTMSAGVSVGYLYSSRNKQISSELGKQKNRGNFDLEPWKFQYVGEIGLGIVKLYGSYTPNSIYKRGLDIRPYNVGLRFGDWWD